MSGGGPHGADRAQSAARSGQGPDWASLGRRADKPVEGAVELRPVAVKPVKGAGPAEEEHHLGERLTAFVDGELSHESRERVQAHLATCADCLAQVDQARAVKRRLTQSGTPAPSDFLMARLLAVAALPDDGPGDGGSADGDLGHGIVGETFGGSRLTGGTFGRGAGSSFGSGALGAEAPIPGVDPRAVPPGFLGGRRAPLAAARPLAAAAAELPLIRSAHPRGRRFVVAAAGAVSVAAVTLGGVGGVGGLGTAAGDGQRGTAVTPVTGSGAGFVPVNAELPLVPHHPVVVAHTTGPSGSPTGQSAVPVRLDRQTR